MSTERKSAGVASAFGRIVRKLRKASGLSQSQLAVAAGLDRTFISMLERGSRQPTLTTLFRVARALRIAPAEMIGQIERAVTRKSGGISSRRL